MEANVEVSESITRKIFELPQAPKQRCIYKVHKKYIHNANDKVFEPATVAIGPYHRGKPGLKMMEELKVRYLYSLLRRKDEYCLEKYISVAVEAELAARSCYADPIDLTAAEFIEMLVIDACFIIELLRRSYNFPFLDYSHDPIFKMKWFLDSLRRDLILLDNQIPMFVLCSMFDSIEDVNPKSTPNPLKPNRLKELIRQFMRMEAMNEKMLLEVTHFLHFTHISMDPNPHDNIIQTESRSGRGDNLEREFRLIPTATELKNANVRFRKSREANKFELHFMNGVLTMAPFIIEDGTESFFRNLVVYEQYFPDDDKPTYMTDYVVLLDCLINTAKDVQILSECGIIENMVGDNQVAADIINRLCHSLALSKSEFSYDKTFKLINAHYKKWWNRSRAALNRDYFNTPWAFISFFAAVLLLGLTITQTIYSVESYKGSLA